MDDQPLSRRRFLHAAAVGAGLLYGTSLVSGCSLFSRGVKPTEKWVKDENNPVFGPGVGTVFDVAVLKEGSKFRMWFSWRDNNSIGLTESMDGVHWGDPVVALAPNDGSGWETKVNRPYVLRKDGSYHLWYTGQTEQGSCLGYAVSPDGIHWTRQSDQPILKPESTWEKNSVMCPSVLYDETTGQFRMWYSGGEFYEPDAIGYATSPDGIHWSRYSNNPIFLPQTDIPWESSRVTGCQVIEHAGWHIMFYIGFNADSIANIGLARSKDGITGWERHPQNPILQPDANGWDADSVFKPYAIFDNPRWMLWYNGRSEKNKFKYREQIGLATYSHEDLGFVIE